jgi:tetratricopeptide (TPR) repeat protein
MELIRRERRSAVAGETQYAFLHALVRDVAYGQIPRAQRVDKHRLAAEWIEVLSSERSEDRAEMLAHHYREALALAAAAGVDTSALLAPARAALGDATERANALNAWAATIDFALAALELMDADDPARPRLQHRVAQARMFLGEGDVDTASSARDGFLAHGDLESAAVVDILLGRLYWLQGDSTRGSEYLTHAVGLVENGPLTFAKVRVFAQRARNESLSGALERAIDDAEEALAMAEELGDDELISHILNTLGMAHVQHGDRGGIAELKRSVEVAEAANSPDAIHTSLNNLANMQWGIGDLEGASTSLARARELSDRFGFSAGSQWLDIEDMLNHELHGNWDEALARANAFLAREGGSKHYLDGPARFVRTLVLLVRGELATVNAEAELLLEHVRETGGEQLPTSLAFIARVFVATGRQVEADALLDELFRDHVAFFPSQWLRELPHLLVELRRGGDYVAAAAGLPPSPWLEAGVAVAKGEFVEAAESYEQIGARATEAWTRLLAAEALVGEGRRREADEQLAHALAFYRAARATPFVRRGETLLAATG